MIGEFSGMDRRIRTSSQVGVDENGAFTVAARENNRVQIFDGDAQLNFRNGTGDVSAQDDILFQRLSYVQKQGCYRTSQIWTHRPAI